MSLEKIETKKNFIPLKKPFKYALASMTELPYVLVTVTENNIIGIGESSPAPDVTGETQESVINIINFIKPLIIGKPVENKKDIENILKILDAYVSNNQAAKSGLEMALFDLLGKKKNLPVYKILNGKNKKKIKLQKTFGFLNENNLENEVKESIAEAKSLGAEIIKYKVGLNKKYDLDLVKFIRKYNPKIKVVVKESVNKDDQNNYCVSAQKLKLVIGWEPKFTIEDGFLEIVEAVKNGLFYNPYDSKYDAWFDKNIFDEKYNL